MRSRGTTLAELAVASFLLGVVLLVSGRLAWLSTRSKSSSEAQNLTFREATIAFGRIQREALHCRELYSPMLVDEIVRPTPTRPFVMRSRNAGNSSGEAVVGYYCDVASEELRRFTYRLDFNPAVPASQVIDTPPEVVARGVIEFELYRIDPLLRSSAESLSLKLVVRNKQARRADALPMVTEARLAR